MLAAGVLAFVDGTARGCTRRRARPGAGGCDRADPVDRPAVLPSEPGLDPGGARRGPPAPTARRRRRIEPEPITDEARASRRSGDGSATSRPASPRLSAAEPLRSAEPTAPRRRQLRTGGDAVPVDEAAPHAPEVLAPEQNAAEAPEPAAESPNAGSSPRHQPQRHRSRKPRPRNTTVSDQNRITLPSTTLRRSKRNQTPCSPSRHRPQSRRPPPVAPTGDQSPAAAAGRRAPRRPRPRRARGRVAVVDRHRPARRRRVGRADRARGQPAVGAQQRPDRHRRPRPAAWSARGSRCDERPTRERRSSAATCYPGAARRRAAGAERHAPGGCAGGAAAARLPARARGGRARAADLARSPA